MHDFDLINEKPLRFSVAATNVRTGAPVYFDNLKQTLGAAHVRVYDPYYTDYHTWNHDEVVYYNQWSVETHRDPHRDFRKLNEQEKKEYWTWRHNHGDHH